MLSSAIDQASSFIRGIAARDAAAVASHVDPARYVEHDGRIGDGVAGLRAFVESLPASGHRLELVRAFADGDHVVVQSHGDVLERQEFFDVFRFAGGAIVEHWGFGAVGGPPNKSGHTQVDGPRQPKDVPSTAANKAAVRAYYETVHLAGQHGRIPEFFFGDLCVRHEPGVADGVAAFTRDLAVLTRRRTIDRIGMLLGQGDFVFLVAEGTHETRPCVYVDLYRVEGGKLVEHWGFPEDAAPAADRRNRNAIL